MKTDQKIWIMISRTKAIMSSINPAFVCDMHSLIRWRFSLIYWLRYFYILLLQVSFDLFFSILNLDQCLPILAEAWIRVRNKGGYVARFYIDYHVPNSPQIVSGFSIPVKLFESTLSSGSYPVGQTRVIGVPRTALTARVRVERFIFYPFFGWYWKEIFRQEFKPQDRLCFDVWGTTIQPYWSSINC